MSKVILEPTVEGSRYISLLSMSISLGAFVFAYNTVCLTQIGQIFKHKNHLTKEQFISQLSIATSAFHLGGILSPIFYRRFVNIFGELKALLIIDVFGICAILFSLIQLQFHILTFARFCLGIVLGLSTAIMPWFVTSIAPIEQVGKLGSYNQLLQTFALITACISGYLIEDNDVNDQVRWRIYLGIPILILLLRIVTLQLYFRFQTLQSCVKNNQIQQIARYCLIIYGNDNPQIIKEIISLKHSQKFQKEYSQTFKMRLIVALVVIAANQLSGTNAINYYAKQLFGKITSQNTSLSQIIIIFMSLFQFIGVLYSRIISDLVGRKNLILKGQIYFYVGQSFCLKFWESFYQFWYCGVYFYAFVQHECYYGALLCYLCFIDVIYVSQILEDITWPIMLMKGMTFIIALTAEYMIEYLGVGYMFLIFFVLGFITHVFLKKNMKQTKGISTEQIYSSFKSDSPQFQDHIQRKNNQFFQLNLQKPQQIQK